MNRQDSFDFLQEENAIGPTEDEPGKSNRPTAGTDASWYEGWDITEEKRAFYREKSNASREARKRAMAGEGPPPVHPIYQPRFDPAALMPQRRRNGIRTLSLFSGGGGLDLGFDLAGFQHVASYDILKIAGETLGANRPEWTVFSGDQGNVVSVDWTQYRGNVDLIHGGPPCQPFSIAGRQRGKDDARNMIPEFIRAVLEISPTAFVAENVPALASQKFRGYIEDSIFKPLAGKYHVRVFKLAADDFGVPQQRVRVFFVGFKNEKLLGRFNLPEHTHRWEPPSERNQQHLMHTKGGHPTTKRCMGVREALGLPDIGFDALAPTIRSTFTGPRHTTSILNSVASRDVWEALEIWPNGVAATRELASNFVPDNEHFRLSVPDCAIMQGFPEWWKFCGPVYMALGQIGNSVAPPVAYNLASAVAKVLE